MSAVTATSAGHPERANEDFVAASDGALVMVDGAGIRGAGHLCEHGVAWYSRHLGTELLTRLDERPGAALPEVLRDSIAQVTAMHGGTCQVADPSSPQASVAVARRSGSELDWLVLGDAYVVVEAEKPLVLTDGREVAVRSAATQRLDGLAPGTPEHDRELRAAIETLRARRNRAGGYWIAKDDPDAALHAVVGRLDLRAGTCVAVLSNGVARLVEPYRVIDWRGLVTLLHDEGPEEVLHQLRLAEAGMSVLPDDASIGCWSAPH